MPKYTGNFYEFPKSEFHRAIKRILSNEDPSYNSALAHWRQKHQEAIKELRGEGKRFKSAEKFESFSQVNKKLEPLYEAVRSGNMAEIKRQKEEIDAWAERMKEKSLTVSPQARQVIMECTIVNLYYLAIAKTMIALLLSAKRRP